MMTEEKSHWSGKKVVDRLMSHSKAATLSQLATKLNVRTQLLEDTQKLEKDGATINYKLVSAVRLRFPELMVKFGWRSANTKVAKSKRRITPLSQNWKPIRLSPLGKATKSTLIPIPPASPVDVQVEKVVAPPRDEPKRIILSEEDARLRKLKPLNPPTPPTPPAEPKPTAVTVPMPMTQNNTEPKHETVDVKLVAPAARKMSNLFSVPPSYDMPTESILMDKLFSEAASNGQEILIKNHIKLVNNSLKLTQAILELAGAA